MKKFTDFGLNETLLDALFYMNFEEATEIQEKAIPTILEGKDLMAVLRRALENRSLCLANLEPSC